MFSKLEHNKLKLLTFGTGFLFLLVTILFAIIEPKKMVSSEANGFHSQIIAFELATSPAEITQILGKMGDSQLEPRVNRFVRIVGLDYFYIFLYSLFFLIASDSLQRNSLAKNSKLNAIFYIVLILLIISDITENILMSEILESNLSRLTGEKVNLLHGISQVKWSLFFLSVSFLGKFLWKTGDSLAIRFHSILLFSAALFIPLFYFYPSLIEIELFFIGLGILLLWAKFSISLYSEKKSSLLPVLKKT